MQSEWNFLDIEQAEIVENRSLPTLIIIHCKALRPQSCKAKRKELNTILTTPWQLISQIRRQKTRNYRRLYDQDTVLFKTMGKIGIQPKLLQNLIPIFAYSIKNITLYSFLRKWLNFKQRHHRNINFTSHNSRQLVTKTVRENWEDRWEMKPCEMLEATRDLQ